MLPHDERILLQVSHVVERRERLELKHQPADVGVKEPLGDAVWVFLVIDMLVVAAVLTGRKQQRVFKGSSAEDQREEPNDPVRLESEVRVEPTIIECYGKSARVEHHKKEGDLKPIDPEEPEICRHCGERET
jgi:hypothetical protein